MASPGTDTVTSAGTSTRNGMGVAALVLGILAVITCWTLVGGVILGVLAIIFGLIGRGRANRGEATNRGAAIAGTILGAIGILIVIVFVAVGATFFFHHKKAIHNLETCLNHATTQAQRNSCNQRFSNTVNGSN